MGLTWPLIPQALFHRIPLTVPRGRRASGGMSGHCRYEAGVYIHAAGCARHPTEAVVCGIPSGRAYSRLPADSVYMGGLAEFAVGILVLGIAGQRGGKRQHAIRWQLSHPSVLCSGRCIAMP